MKKKSVRRPSSKSSPGKVPEHVVKPVHVPKAKPGMGLAVAALVINVILLPGLGTIIGGRIKHGLLQLLLLYIGGWSVGVIGAMLLLSMPALGIVLLVSGGIMLLAGWIWAIVSGVMLVRDASS